MKIYSPIRQCLLLLSAFLVGCDSNYAPVEEYSPSRTVQPNTSRMNHSYRAPVRPSIQVERVSQRTVSPVIQRKTEVLSSVKITQTSSVTSAKGWHWPVLGSLVGRFDPPARKGLEIVAKEGTTVVAARAGTVAYAGEGLRGLGKLVIVKHDDQYLTAYGYNSRVLVHEGQKVNQGEKIAEVGHTGNAPRSQLHFEIRKQGQPVDPLPYLEHR